MGVARRRILPAAGNKPPRSGELNFEYSAGRRETLSHLRNRERIEKRTSKRNHRDTRDNKCRVFGAWVADGR